MHRRVLFMARSSYRILHLLVVGRRQGERFSARESQMGALAGGRKRRLERRHIGDAETPGWARAGGLGQAIAAGAPGSDEASRAPTPLARSPDRDCRVPESSRRRRGFARGPPLAAPPDAPWGRLCAPWAAPRVGAGCGAPASQQDE